MADKKKRTAIRVLIRRGLNPARVHEEDAANADQASKRTLRGNISLILGNVQTPEELQAEREDYRAKHAAAR
jgi:hypothetical protein